MSDRPGRRLSSENLTAPTWDPPPYICEQIADNRRNAETALYKAKQLEKDVEDLERIVKDEKKRVTGKINALDEGIDRIELSLEEVRKAADKSYTRIDKKIEALNENIIKNLIGDINTAGKLGTIEAQVNNLMEQKTKDIKRTTALISMIVALAWLLVKFVIEKLIN